MQKNADNDDRSFLVKKKKKKANSASGNTAKQHLKISERAKNYLEFHTQ